MARISVLTAQAQADLLRFQESSGYLNDLRLESFGFFLADYTIRGAELTFDEVDPLKALVSEGIISFDDNLWRSFVSEFRLKNFNTTYYVGFLAGKGYIIGETEPSEEYLRIWSIPIDANGVVGVPTDHRVLLGKVKFKATYDGVYFNTQEVNDAIDAAIQAKDDTYVAIDEMKAEAAEWNYEGYYNPTLSYNEHNVVSVAGSMYIAIQDVPVGTIPTGELYDAYWRLYAKKGADGTGTVFVHRDEFIATAGQTVFTLSNSYDQFQNRIDADVGGVPQFSPDNFIESSPTTATFTEGVPGGTKVIFTYFSEAVPLATDLEVKVNNHTIKLNTNNNLLDTHTALLADMGTTVNSHTTNLNTNNNLLIEHAGKLDSHATQLLDKLNKGQVSVFDINKNKGLIDETYLANTLKAQIAGTAAIGSTPPNKSITLEKITFAKKGKNLFNKAAVTLNVVINTTTGAEISDANFDTSEHIPILPNTQYSKQGGYSFAVYDAMGAYISGGNLTTFTTPTNAATVRISTTKAVLNNQQLEIGAVNTTYEPYSHLIESKYVEPRILTIPDIPALPIEKVSFTKTKTNLFNKADVVMDSYVAGSNGGILSTAGFVASGFILIKPSTAYIIKIFRHHAFYDVNKVYISGSSGTTPTNFKIVMPANAFYFRFSWYPPSDGVSLDTQQMNEGAELLPYESHGTMIAKEFLELPTFIAEPERKSILPPKIYAVVGKEINIYFENTLTVPQKDIEIDISCSIGRQDARRWTAIPTAAGTFPLTISVYRNFVLTKQTTTDIIVKAATVGAGNKNVLIIGDSTINEGTTTQRLLDLSVTDPMKITLLGTRATSTLNRHEGRGGWSGALYRTGATYLNVVNPFYNPDFSDFDFTYYMTNQAYAAVDYVGICLGINETFSPGTDASLITTAADNLTHLDAIIASIKAFNSAIKVGVFITIPPNESQDSFGLAYANGQSQWRYKRNNALWIDALIKHYKDKEGQGIYLIPDNSNIDAKNGFDISSNGGVHPNVSGYSQRGDTLHYYFKSFEV